MADNVTQRTSDSKAMTAIRASRYCPDDIDEATPTIGCRGGDMSMDSWAVAFPEKRRR